MGEMQEIREQKKRKERRNKQLHRGRSNRNIRLRKDRNYIMGWYKQKMQLKMGRILKKGEEQRKKKNNIWTYIYRDALTVIILQQDGQDFTAVQLVSIKRHLCLKGKESEVQLPLILRSSALLRITKPLSILQENLHFVTSSWNLAHAD